MQEEGKEQQEDDSDEENNGYASLGEVARIFKVGKRKLRDWINKGYIQVVKPIHSQRGHVRVSLKSVRDFIKKNSTKPRNSD